MMEKMLQICREVRWEYILSAYPEDPVEWLQQSADDLDLCMHCARASQALFQRFVEEGFSPVLCVSMDDDHVWVRIDHISYDLTAKQFGAHFPPVYVFEFDEGHGEPSFESDDIEEFQSYLRKTGWPAEQIA